MERRLVQKPVCNVMSTVVLAPLAIQTCLRVYEELKVDETRLLRIHFPSDLSLRQPGPIPGVLFGEAILRNLNRAYQLCLAEANPRIADFRRRNLAMTPASSSGSASMPPPAAPPPLPPPALTPLTVAQAKHPSVSPASGVSGLDMGLRPPAPRSPAPLTPPGRSLLVGLGLLQLLPHLWSGWRIQFLLCSGIFRGTRERATTPEYYESMRAPTEEGPIIPRPPDVPRAPMLGVIGPAHPRTVRTTIYQLVEPQ